MKTSWKTTLCGSIAALGAFLATQTDPSWLPVLGKLLAGAGAFGIGMFARDNDKSSEDIGVK